MDPSRESPFEVDFDTCDFDLDDQLVPPRFVGVVVSRFSTDAAVPSQSTDRGSTVGPSRSSGRRRIARHTRRTRPRDLEHLPRSSQNLPGTVLRHEDVRTRVALLPSQASAKTQEGSERQLRAFKPSVS